MRPIKFKGKIVGKNDWAYGFYMESILSEKKYFIIADLLTKEFVEVIPETVCQLIKVVNGVEIYEGDINQDGGVVIWNEDDASFCWEYKGIDIQPMGDESEWCMIVRNIND